MTDTSTLTTLVGLGQGGSMIWENPHYRGGRKGK